MQLVVEFRNEEKLNAISHLVGALLSIVAMFLLLSRNSCKTEYATFSILVYSISLISMFIVSATYHFSKNKRLKKIFRILDHSNIYVLIAGTYTPVALITLVNGNGWSIFYAVWAIATFGILFKIFFTGKFEFLSLLLYLAMGWLIVFDFDNLKDNMPLIGLQLLFLGGAFYTFGIFFMPLKEYHSIILSGIFLFCVAHLVTG